MNRGDGSPSEPYREDYRPVQDELIRQVLQVAPEFSRDVDPQNAPNRPFFQSLLSKIKVSEATARE